MATKRKRGSTTKKPPVQKVKLGSRNEVEHLETLIMFSERAISSHGNSIDEFFTQQSERLKKQLKELRARK